MFSKLFKNKIKNTIYDIAGNKESLAIRLAKHDLNQSPQSKGKEQLAEYLNLSQKKKKSPKTPKFTSIIRQLSMQLTNSIDTCT